MKLVAFELSMPGVGSWNGKWSGEGRKYVIIRKFLKAQDPDGKLDKGTWFYRWPDGWVAMITSRKISFKESESLRKASDGFLGYDWMVASIIRYGEIRKPESVNCT